MAKKRMPIYGTIGILRAILAHNLGNYQHFSMRPGLFDKYYQITYSMQFVAWRDGFSDESMTCWRTKE